MRLVGLQHLLPSIVLQMRRLVDANRFSEIMLYSKGYSDIEGVSHRLPPEIRFAGQVGGASPLPLLLEPVVLLDEGGVLYDLVERGPVFASGVEQTASGLRDHLRWPTVLTCRSAAKRFFESQVIAQGIMRKLSSLSVITPQTQVGILGLGALGSELARLMLERGHKVNGFEINAFPPDLQHISVSQADLLANSDLILGCSGRDVFIDSDVRFSGRSKIFASCSSRDVEFRTLLNVLPVGRAYETASGFVNDSHCVVLNGGFPINFDRKQEWERPEEIALTRSLIGEAVVQAADLIGAPALGIMQDPVVQASVVRAWITQLGPQTKLRMPTDLTEAWFVSNSEGYLATGNAPYQVHSTTPVALERMRSHRKRYEVRVGKFTILVFPNVWSPAYDWSSAFYIENMPDLTGKSFLEIGSGTGVISVAAARAGATRVIAVDVNPAAVENTKANFERFRLANATALRSDGFQAVKGQFDVVTWNAPYHGSKPADDLERGCADEDYKDITAFFEAVDKHLRPNGQVVFGFSESGDLPRIKRLIQGAGFRIVRTLSDWRQDYNCMLFFLERAPKQPDGASLPGSGSKRNA